MKIKLMIFVKKTVDRGKWTILNTEIYCILKATDPL